MRLRSVLGSLLPLLLCACSSSDDDELPAGTGGALGAGGALASGGTVGPAVGGAMPSSGGQTSPGPGGSTSSGGIIGAGGGPDTGGGSASGGVPSDGGASNTGGDGGAPSSGGTPSTGGQGGEPTAGCQGLTIAPATDYGAQGPYGAQTVNDTGPDGTYTLIRPAKLGENGTKHPVMTWGNGITTTPALYPGLLNAMASHGFVIIASNNTNVTAALMTQGLDWLIQQNTATGALQGKLEPKCAVTVGYSLGGGAAVGSGSHADVVATVSFHGLQGPAQNLKGPLLLFTTTADGFVTKAGYVQPCYNASTKQPTILATLDIPGAAADFAGHLYPLNDAGDERAPAIAWLRLWVYGDQAAKKYFYGTDCLLCKSPWMDIQRKNATW